MFFYYLFMCYILLHLLSVYFVMQKYLRSVSLGVMPKILYSSQTVFIQIAIIYMRSTFCKWKIYDNRKYSVDILIIRATYIHFVFSNVQFSLIAD